MNLGGWEIVIILGVLVLLFGAKRLPDMARSIGQSARVLKGEMKGLKDDGAKAEPDPPAAQADPAQIRPSAAKQAAAQQAAEPATEQQTRSGQ